jgi:ubiquinone biosynthesis protein COQ9
LVVAGRLKFENRTRQTVVPSIYARIQAQQKTHRWLKKKLSFYTYTSHVARENNQ